MHKITFNLTELHKHGSAFFEFLGLRKQFFVDQLGWDIPHDDDVEMDQYDNPKAYYSLVIEDGRVIAGGRAMATTAQWGSHTYMLRDAVEGKIIGLPETIVAEAEITASVWECTRVVVSSDIKDPVKSAECLSLIVEGLAEQALAQGGTELMALSRPSLMRALRKIGYAPQMIGKPYVNAEDGRRYVAMRMDITGRTADPVPVAVPAQTHVSSSIAVHAPAKL